jgi:hypothetical protein
MIRSKTFQTGYELEISSSMDKLLIEKKFNKVFEEGYIKSTPVVERKYYNEFGRKTELLTINAKSEKCYNELGSASTQSSVDDIIPKMNETTLTSLTIINARLDLSTYRIDV